MFRSYLIIAFRNLLKRETSSWISIAGLAIAISCSIFILLFIFDELQFDRFHVNGDRIYRVVYCNSRTGEKAAIMAGVLFPAMMSEVPEFETGFRLTRRTEQPIRAGERLFTGELFFADPEMIHMMTFPLERGNPGTALQEPFTAVITDSLAKKYFGQGDPIGKTFTIDDKYEFRITGILRDIPRHSHIHPEFIASLSSYNTIHPGLLNDIRESGTYFYFLLKPNASPGAAEAKLKTIFEAHHGKDSQGWGYALESLGQIYLHSAGTQWDIAAHGNILYVESFAVIATLILFMASFNYSNFLTARVKIREKEISVRRLLGGTFRSILSQFLVETVSYMLISLALALVIVEVFMSKFNQLSGKELAFSSMLAPGLVSTILGLLAVTTVASVLYPATIAATSDPLYRLKGGTGGFRFTRSHIHIGFRQTITLLQFVITISLIASTAVIYRQLEYMRMTNLGFNKEHLVSITNPYGAEMYSRFESFKNEIRTNPQIEAVSAGTNVPSENLNNYTQMWIRNNKSGDGIHTAQVAVDYDYFSTLQAKFISGRDFSRERKTDANEAVILNAEAVKALGLHDAVGSELSGVNNASDPQKVIGVIDNIHFRSFREKVVPTLFFLRPWSATTIVLRLKGADISSTMTFLEEKWKTVVPNQPFIYAFLDDSFDSLYRTDQQTSNITIVFCFLALVLSSIGLFSIISLVSQSRRKEIGVRKVLGASLMDVLVIMTREYLLIVLAANFLAWPLAYYVMNKWLEDFAYRIDLSWTRFGVAGGLAFLIALITVSVQAINAGIANPVDSLRTE